MSLLPKIKPVMLRLEEVNALLAEGTAQGEAYIKLTKEYAELRPVVEVAERYEKALQEMADLPALKSDPDLSDMAAEEEQRLKSLLPQLEHQIKLALLPKDQDDTRNAILEIRAGTGRGSGPVRWRLVCHVSRLCSGAWLAAGGHGNGRK